MVATHNLSFHHLNVQLTPVLQLHQYAQMDAARGKFWQKIMMKSDDTHNVQYAAQAPYAKPYSFLL